MHHGHREKRHRDRHEFAVERRVEFKVHPRGKYDYRQAVFRRPMFIGDFSLDDNRQFCHDRRNLNYIPVDFESTKEVEYDLNIGMDKVVRKDYEVLKKDKLSQLLNWLLVNKHKFHTKDNAGRPLQSLSTDFICFRGLLRDILCMPYENKERIILCATKFRGTIYMWSYETPEKKADREAQTEEQLKMCSWGYKFEQYMTEGSDISEGVNENSEYSCVLRSRLEKHSIVYSAEVDGVNPEKYESPPVDLRAFVELKTNKILNEERDVRSLHRFKLMKWWSQSYLVGIPTVVCGFRDNNGVVQSLKIFGVEEMPSLGQAHWKSNIMMNFLDKFLTFVKQQVIVDDPTVVYKFERDTVGGDISCKYLGKDSNWSILPDWYYKEMFRA
ncbi:decapping and exoribonuclease protein-like isoform X1 [Macrobrachium rosenbergii]|uniref:decapping and exoribonuclease protein-like isoform X1 n=1 Tax=Macrobrachium rosenbergii TaxID=79674 RepID=UPI0034D5F51A